MGTSKIPGAFTCPVTPTNLRPATPFAPNVLNHSGPLAAMAAANARVSTLLMTVGLFHNPTDAMKGGLLRGSARSAHAQAAEDHSLQHQMWQLGQNKAIFNGAGLAFIGIADQIFFRRSRLAHRLPLQMRGITGAAHALQPASLDLGQQAIPIS